MVKIAGKIWMSDGGASGLMVVMGCWGESKRGASKKVERE